MNLVLHFLHWFLLSSSAIMSEMVVTLVIVSLMVGYGRSICGVTTPDSCARQCCCSDTFIRCADALTFPPVGLTPHSQLTLAILERGCIPVIYASDVDKMLRSLERIEFQMGCKDCVHIYGDHEWMVIGRAICSG